MSLFSGRWLAAAALALSPLGVLPVRAQDDDAATARESSLNTNDPSELYLRAYTSVQQAEALEQDGKLRPALSKYRFAASMLDQLTQSNPNWQPLIVKYRQRKTSESIQKLEEKGVVLQNPGPSGARPPAAPSNSYGRPATLPSVPPGLTANPDDDLPTPDNAPGLPAGRGNGTVSAGPQGVETPPAPAPEVADRASQQLRNKLEKTQKELKNTLDALAVVKREKQDIAKQKDELESQMQSSRSQANIAQKRYEHTKADRDDLQSELTKVEGRLKDAVAKNPAVAVNRKELRDQVDDLKKQLAKAQAETEAAAKSRDEVQAKFDVSEKTLTQTTQELNAAVARNELTKDAAQKIEALQSENTTLSQKLSSAESSIVKLTVDSQRKKQELDGMTRELTALKDQLASSRDQNDRSATTITALRAQLDESARHIDELKAKGTDTEEYAKLSKENEMLRGIVIRQQKDQSRRAAVKQMLADELARLDIQNTNLSRQLELLGQPSVQLTDEERALFKDPVATVADATGPNSVAATISAFRSPKPGAPPAAGSEPAAPGGVARPGDAAQNLPPDPVANKAGPQVQTAIQPPVSDDLLPMAKEAKESFDRQHYAEAERTYDKLLARDPKNPYLLSNQGVVLFRQDKLKSAEVMLKKAVAAAPNDAFGQATLGIVYYRMHRYDEAMASLTTALTISPKNATAHNYLGITASQKGYPEAAIDELGKAIALNPSYADAYFNLAVVLATKQPPDKARAHDAYNTAVRLGAGADPTLEKLIGS